MPAERPATRAREPVHHRDVPLTLPVAKAAWIVLVAGDVLMLYGFFGLYRALDAIEQELAAASAGHRYG